ncbi:phage tail assembly protein [Paraburkholderia sp. BR14263]|uniref:phage tail assembly protein n=1 Tax=unclassified Paraburkholderia TaxID=2615204 RepID=UPI0034CD6B28
MKTFKLKFPYALADGRELKEVTLRRGKVRELKPIQSAHAGDPFGMMLALLCLLSPDQLTPEDIEEMDIADFTMLQDYFRDIMGEAGRNQEAVGAAG